MKLTKFKIFSIIVIFLISFLIVLSGVCPTYVRADDSAVKFDKTNVLDDLQDMTLGGKPFSLEEYNFDTKKNTQILSFIEYCYSFYEEKKNDFGLYVYVYNPKGLKFDTDSSLNMIQFAITKDTDSAYTKYPLTYLNKSEKVDYEGLFYKFKVDLTEKQKTAILAGVNSSNRIYKVSGIELVTKGALNATDYTVSLTYKYSGYAKGCGPNENAESTLSFTSEGLETLSLDVHSTTYRPDGTNGKNDYTQDSLHSVYFAVPNEVIAQYGEMVAVHATWLNAVLKPALVTGNQEAYNVFSQYLGVPNSEYNLDVNYMYVGADTTASEFDKTYHYYGYLFNSILTSATSHSFSLEHKYVGDKIETLYFLYNAGSGINSADNFTVSSESIISRLAESSERFGGNLINGKYSECMFESVDKEFTDKTIYADKEYSLNSFKNVIGDSWWEKLWGLTVSKNYSSAFNGIQAIYPVKDSDLSGTDEQISNKLYVSQNDVADFKSYYENNSENSTVYLFRYQVSDYIAQEATLYKYDVNFSGERINKVDTNAYFFQETINLDFDVIDVTLSTGEVETVIPVVSNPIDVIPDATPPVYTETDKSFNLLKLIIGLLLLILLIWFLNATGALPLIVKSLIWIITAPFKFVKWLTGKFRGD